MGHPVDGFDLKFTSRRSWKAERRDRGKLIDIIPVTWADAWDARKGTLEVYYQDADEMEKARLSHEPFIVALAEAKHPIGTPRVFQEFKGIFEVMATGESSGDAGINTRVRKRIVAGRKS